MGDNSLRQVTAHTKTELNGWLRFEFLEDQRVLWYMEFNKDYVQLVQEGNNDEVEDSS